MKQSQQIQAVTFTIRAFHAIIVIMNEKLTHKARADSITPLYNEGGMCMVGGIYSQQKCPLCKCNFMDNKRNALICTNHPDQKATRFCIYFRSIFKRFKSYDEAARFLTGVRFKTDEGSFDSRDYRKDVPLGFSNLTEKWLETKKGNVGDSQYRNLKRYVGKASERFGNKNIKDINYGELEDLILAQTDVADKEKANMKSGLHTFFVWLKKRKVIDCIPEFPEVHFELGYRKTIDLETQNAFLEEIKRICPHEKVYWGIKWLCTYIAIRPGELINLKEGEIDYGNRLFLIPFPKEDRYKPVPVLQEDIDLLKSLPRGLPNLYVFRHKDGQHYGEKYFYKWWKRAGENLGITDVDLYGGTRHSTVKYLRQYFSFEEIKIASMHSTNKAFERYFQFEIEDVTKVYQKIRSLQKQG